MKVPAAPPELEGADERPSGRFSLIFLMIAVLAVTVFVLYSRGHHAPPGGIPDMIRW